MPSSRPDALCNHECPDRWRLALSNEWAAGRHSRSYRRTRRFNGGVYFQQRATDEDAYSAVPGLPEPIFRPQFDGKTLLFEVSHRRSHPPRTLNDPPKHFRLTLRDADTAELVNVDEPETACKVVRSNY